VLKSLRIGDEAEQEVIDFLHSLSDCVIAHKNDNKETRIEHDIV
jgi:hypothetical protein